MDVGKCLLLVARDVTSVVLKNVSKNGIYCVILKPSESLAQIRSLNGTWKRFLTPVAAIDEAMVAAESATTWFSWSIICGSWILFGASHSNTDATKSLALLGSSRLPFASENLITSPALWFQLDLPTRESFVAETCQPGRALLLCSQGVSYCSAKLSCRCT